MFFNGDNMEKKSKKKSRQKNGLSLIEATVATLILAIILISVLGIFQQGYYYMRKVQRSATAYFLAQSIFEEWCWPGEIFPNPGSHNSTTQKNFTSPYNEYNWTMTFITPPAGLAGHNNLTQMNVTVYWQGLSGQRSVSLVTLLGNFEGIEH
jgi:hypothetical protein